MKRFWKRIGAAGSAALLGVFLTIRLRAFLIQAWGLELPGIAVYVGMAGLGLLGWIFAGPAEGFLRRWAEVPARWGVAAMLASLLTMVFLRENMLSVQLRDTGMGVGTAASVLYLLGGGMLLGLFLCCLLRGLRGRLGRGFGVVWCKWDLVFFLLVLAGTNLAVWLYARGSATIYSWDVAGYWTRAHRLADLWRQDGLPAMLRQVGRSVLDSDYNDLPVLPATVFARLFGRSRYVFLAAIGNFGYVPVAAMVWLMTRRGGRHPRLVAGAVLLALPVMLHTVLAGFLDISGCIFTLGALVIWAENRESRSFGRFLWAGLLLSLAILTRRWYAFYGVAFLLALGLDCLLFRRSPAPLLGAVAGAAVPLLLFFQPLVSQRLLADYGKLYEAYDLGLGRDALLLLRYFGLIPLAASAALAVYYIIKKDTRQRGVFLLTELALCFLLFVRVQTHGQQHLLLYVPGEAMLLAMGFGDLLRLEKRRAVAVTLALALLPTLSPFLPRTQPATLEELHEVAALPSFSWMPPRRKDAMDVVNMVRALDKYGAEGKTVGLLASSLTLNEDVLRNAEISLSLPEPGPRDYLAALPQVDQRDGWWDTVFYCDMLLVADPVQLHLGEENQMVIALPARALLEGTGFGTAYRVVDRWSLDGMEVLLYEKIREPDWADQEALRQAFFAAHPEAACNGASIGKNN